MRPSCWVSVAKSCYTFVNRFSLRWQKLRSAEVLFEKDMKETALSKLTTREREVRKRIEDILDPQSSRSANEASAKAPLKSLNTKPSANGHTKPKVNGEVKKGKKRKAPVT
jgi:COMPASS component SPP1